MQVVTIDDTKAYSSKDRTNIVEDAFAECKKIGAVNEQGNVLIYVDDIDSINILE